MDRLRWEGKETKKRQITREGTKQITDYRGNGENKASGLFSGKGEALTAMFFLVHFGRKATCSCGSILLAQKSSRSWTVAEAVFPLTTSCWIWAMSDKNCDQCFHACEAISRMLLTRAWALTCSLLQGRHAGSFPFPILQSSCRPHSESTRCNGGLHLIPSTDPPSSHASHNSLMLM